MRAGQIWTSKLNVDINPHDIKLIKYLGGDLWRVKSGWPKGTKLYDYDKEGISWEITGHQIINLYNLKLEA